MANDEIPLPKPKLSSNRNRAYQLIVSAFGDDFKTIQESLERPDLTEGGRRAIQKILRLRVQQASPTHLAELLAFLQQWWPLGLRHAEVRCAVSVALSQDLLGIEDLAQCLSAFLSTADQARTWIYPDASAPHGVRLRAAVICRSIASAARIQRGVVGLIPASEERSFYEATASLFTDRSLSVAMHAAWALGLLAGTEPSLSNTLENSLRKGVSAGLARRALIARVAQLVIGDLDGELFLNELQASQWYRNPATHSSLIFALTLGQNIAPQTTCAIVRELLLADASVLANGFRFASFVQDTSMRAELTLFLDELVSKCQGLSTAAPTGELAFWMRQQHPLATPLVDQFHALRQQAKTSLAATHSISETLLSQAQSTISQLHGLRVDAQTSVDIALNYVLVENTLLRDSLRGSAVSKEERTLRQQAWAKLLDELYDHRMQVCKIRNIPPDVLCDRLRSLELILDVLDRSDSPDGVGASEAFQRRVRECVVFALSILDSKEQVAVHTEVIRPAVRLLLTGLDALVARGIIPASDILALALRARHKKVISAIREFVTRSEIGVALDRLIALQQLLEKRVKQTNVNEQSDIIDLLREFVKSAGVLMPAGHHELSNGLNWLVTAVIGMIPGPMDKTVVPLGQAWTSAVAQLSEAQRTTFQRLTGASNVASQSNKIEAVFRGVFSAKVLGPQEAVANPENIEKAETLLPFAMRGLLRIMLRSTATKKKQPKLTKPPTSTSKEVFGDYEVVKELGSGQMGRCLLVRQRSFLRKEPMKYSVLKVPKQGSPVGLFREEANALLKLIDRHPCIVRFESFTDNGGALPFLVMQYIEGVNLEERLQQSPALELKNVLAMMIGLVGGLAVAHSEGIGHYDIKPANIIVPRDGSRPAILVDWGLAGAGLIGAGTPYYMAPERYQQSPTVKSLPSDVFSLGVTLYELLTCKNLLDGHVTLDDSKDFQGDFSPSLLASAYPVLCTRIQQHLASFSPQLRALVEKMVHPTPSNRPTCKDLHKEFSKLS